jgi:hypothetical protein
MQLSNSKGRKAEHHQRTVSITSSKGNGEYTAGREGLQGNECYIAVSLYSSTHNWRDQEIRSAVLSI